MRFLATLVYIAVSLITGFLLIGISTGLIDAGLISFYIQDTLISNFYYSLTLTLLGVLIILFCLRQLQYLLFRSRRERALTLESPEGKVSITIFAIEELIRKLLEEKAGISRIRPKVGFTKKIMEVIIKCNLASQANLLEVTKEIQKKIKIRLNSLLGEGREIKVAVIIKKIIVAGRAQVEEEEEPTAPFRNY